MLDLVSTILFRLETLNPKAFPLWPLFMKFPNASTTSRTWVRRLLRTTSTEAFRMAGGKQREEKQLLRSYIQLVQLCILHNKVGLSYSFHSVTSLKHHRDAGTPNSTPCSPPRIFFIFNIIHDEWSVFSTTSTRQLGGKSIPSFHPSVKQQGRNGIYPTWANTVLSFTLRRDCLAKYRWFPVSTEETITVTEDH